MKVGRRRSSESILGCSAGSCRRNAAWCVREFAEPLLGDPTAMKFKVTWTILEGRFAPRSIIEKIL